MALCGPRFSYLAFHSGYNSGIGFSEHRSALACLRRAIHPRGLLASPTDTANYRRIWARDSVVCGLAGCIAHDDELIEALGASLSSLAEAMSPRGFIPSNVAADDESPPSYGGLAGRVDAGAWFVIGAIHYLRRRPDAPEIDGFGFCIEQVLELYEYLELNGRGLVNTPMGGCWADEYPLHGYTLTEQLLRIWALRLGATFFDRQHYRQRADELAQLVHATYWIDDKGDPAASYHPGAYRAAQTRGEVGHWMASLSPGGYQQVFDALANALAVLLGVGEKAHRTRALATGVEATGANATGLVPAFWPPIREGEPGWKELEGLSLHGLRNRPGEYHNGGLWPMVNGFWGSALHRGGDGDEAARLLDRCVAANQLGDGGFYEFISAQSGDPGGTRECTWSAAGELMLAAVLDGQSLDWE